MRQGFIYYINPWMRGDCSRIDICRIVDQTLFKLFFSYLENNCIIFEVLQP